MVVALRLIRSRSMIVCVTPDLNSWRPVISAQRVGEQVGLTWKSVNRTPSSCRRSMFGVFSTGIAVARHVAVTLVINEDEDDIGLAMCRRAMPRSYRTQRQQGGQSDERMLRFRVGRALADTCCSISWGKKRRTISTRRRMFH